MNERIKDIFEQACFETDYDDVQDLHETMNKFAELIVQECLSYAKEGDLDFMKFMIKKNFGVEE